MNPETASDAEARCFQCDELTNIPGEDSLFDEEGVGPFCQGCYDELVRQTAEIWEAEHE